MTGRRVATVAALAFASCANAQQWVAIPLGQPGEQYSYAYAVTASRQGGTYRPPLHGGPDQAGFWSGTSGSWTRLSPVDQSAVVYGMDDLSQVGSFGYAVLWHGTPESLVNLGPPGVPSDAFAVRGNMQVGDAYTPQNEPHAALWRGTADSFVDLNPAGALRSIAHATDGVLQGGEASLPNQHAALWNGTAQSFMDLNPPGHNSIIYGMAPGVQVGSVYLAGSGDHAAIWNGTAQSFVDLNPPGANSILFATTGTVHAGELSGNGFARAAINFGTADSWLSLHQFLPAGFSTFSHASAIVQDGNTLYVGGWATRDDNSQAEAFLWVGTVPAPSSAALLLGAGLFASRGRRRTI